MTEERKPLPTAPGRTTTGARKASAKSARSRRLRHMPAFDLGMKRDHQVGPHCHAAGFRGRAFQRVPDIGERLAFHPHYLARISRIRALASSMSFCAVAPVFFAKA